MYKLIGSNFYLNKLSAYTNIYSKSFSIQMMNESQSFILVDFGYPDWQRWLWFKKD